MREEFAAYGLPAWSMAAMHLKVRDPIKKALPALTLLGLSCVVILL